MIECTELDGPWGIGMHLLHSALSRKDYKSAKRTKHNLKRWLEAESKTSANSITKHYATILFEILEKEGE